MIILELISRKRNPIKRNAFLGMGFGLFILIIIASKGQLIENTIKVILMIFAACLFIIGLFIINFSYKFKKVIGSISFSADFIEIDLPERKEMIRIDQLKSIRFRLSGFEGWNKSTLFENIMFPVTRLSYHGGINNLLYLNSGERTRRFEFYIPNRKTWVEIKHIAIQYQEKLRVLRGNK